MRQVSIPLPLIDSADYKYTVALEGVSYEIRIYYNERVEWWAFDLSYADGDPIALGQRLSARHPLYFDYNIEGLSGFFYLYPKGQNKNYTLLHPLKLHKYYNFEYTYLEDSEDEQ